MGVRGLARDLAAAGLGTLKPLVVPSVVDAGPGPDVRTDDAEGCPAFYAQAVSGVHNGASPDWLARRLTAIGQKPISALVDITNYVMIDLGRPLHVYDRARLSGPLVARRAREGEQVLALNGRTYPLDPSMTVIADDAQVHDIGGIMGGEHSGVSTDTTDVLIECAFFDPDRIALTGQKLTLTSDARQRFERGVDPAFLDDGLSIAADLVLRLCGGSASGVTRAGTPPLATRSYTYDPALAETLGGNAVAAKRQRAILESLGFVADDDWQVTPPTWRRDVDGPADIVEEVIRIDGIDKVAAVPLPRAPGVARPTATPDQKLERRLRRAAAAHGLNEAVTWSFLSEAQAAAFGGGAWSLANPISEDLKVMRPSLLPGLLAATERNLKRGASQQCGYSRSAGATSPMPSGRRSAQCSPAIVRRAAGVAVGHSRSTPLMPRHRRWCCLPKRAHRSTICRSWGKQATPGTPASRRRCAWGRKRCWRRSAWCTPMCSGRSTSIVRSPRWSCTSTRFPARRASGLLRPTYQPPVLQAVTRDFAFRVPEALAAGDLIRAIRGADKAAIVAARVFDVFERDGVKSMAVEVTLQPGDKSFTEADFKALADKVVAAAAKLGAELRG